MTLVTVLACAGLAGGALAFEWQAGGGYGVTSVDSLPDDIKAVAAGADYYFTGVSNDRNPYDLQPFFQKAPYGQARYTADDFGPLEFQFLHVNAELFMSPPVRGLSFRPHFLHVKAELTGFAPATTNQWMLDIGYYFLDEFKVTLPGVLVGFVDPDQGDAVDEDLSFKRILVQYVARMGGQDVMFEGDYLDPDGEMVFFVIGGTYYASKELGVALAIAQNDAGFDNLSAGVSYWATPMVRMGLQVTVYSEDGWYRGLDRRLGPIFRTGEATTVSVTAAARF